LVAHIVPPERIKNFPLYPYNLALAHWVSDFPSYVKFLADSITYVVLDNGAFEGEQPSVAALGMAAQRVKADELVLPDVPGCGDETIGMSWKAFRELRPNRVMFVPQGKNLDEWCNCLDGWLKIWGSSRDEFLSIGIASLCNEDGTRQYKSKTDTLIYAAKTCPDRPIHLLGMTTPSYFMNDLLPKALEYEVRGVDTSTAFVLGSMGIPLTVSAPKHRLRRPGSYQEMSTYNIRLALLNQALLDCWCSPGTHYVPAFGMPEEIIRRVAGRWLEYSAKGFQNLGACLRVCGLQGEFIYDGIYVRPASEGGYSLKTIRV